MSITSIINVSSEGSIARASVESALAAAAYAQARNLKVRTIVVADRPTPDTIAALEPYEPQVEIVEIDAGDLGLARNHGASLADGDFVAFLDGDDLWTKRWLWAAHGTASADGNEQAIIHAQYNVIFGCGEDHIYEHISSRDPSFDPRYLIFGNYWLSPSFGRTAAYLSCRYQANRLGSGFGYEDWKWNCDTLRAGYEHLIGPNTYHLIRRRHRSLRQQSIMANCLMTPSPRFFDRAEPHAAASQRKPGIAPPASTRSREAQDRLAAPALKPAPAGRHVFQSFWWGDSITPYEALCMRSFIDHGHGYHLYTYAPRLNVPAGVVVRDASELLSKEDYFEYRDRHSPAAFSCAFRYKLLAAKGGWWVDTDVICLTGQIPSCEQFFALESETIVNTATLYFPASHSVVLRCLADALATRGEAKWGDLGPRLITTTLRELGLMEHAQPPASCYPIHWKQALDFLDPTKTASILERARSALFVHLWNEIYRLEGIDKTLRPPAGSFLRQMADRHPVEGWRDDAPTTNADVHREAVPLPVSPLR